MSISTLINSAVCDDCFDCAIDALVGEYLAPSFFLWKNFDRSVGQEIAGNFFFRPLANKHDLWDYVDSVSSGVSDVSEAVGSRSIYQREWWCTSLPSKLSFIMGSALANLIVCEAGHKACAISAIKSKWAVVNWSAVGGYAEDVNQAAERIMMDVDLAEAACDHANLMRDIIWDEGFDLVKKMSVDVYRLLLERSGGEKSARSANFRLIDSMVVMGGNYRLLKHLIDSGVQFTKDDIIDGIEYGGMCVPGGAECVKIACDHGICTIQDLEEAIVTTGSNEGEYSGAAEQQLEENLKNLLQNNYICNDSICFRTH